MFEPGRTWETTIDKLEERGLLQLAHVICERNHVTIDELCGRSRLQHIALARFHLWFYLYTKKNMSTRAIGFLFGMDRTSVMNGIKVYGESICENLE